MEGGTYYCAHPELSTRMIASALAVRERFEPLIADAERLDPEAFQAAYRHFLTDVQAHL